MLLFLEIREKRNRVTQNLGIFYTQVRHIGIDTFQRILYSSP